MELELAVLQTVDFLATEPDLQSLMNFMAQMLGRPVWLTDLNYQFLTDPGSALPIPAPMQEDYRQGSIHQEGIRLMRVKQVERTIQEQRTPYIYSDEHLKQQIMSVGVRIRRTMVACLSTLEMDRPFTSQDQLLMERFGGLVALELQRSGVQLPEAGSLFSTLLREMLDSHCSSMKRIYERMTALRYRLYPRLRVLVVSHAEYVDGNNRALWLALEGQISHIFPGSLFAADRGYLVVLLNQESPITGRQKEQIEHLLKESGLRACISYAFDDLAAFYEVYTNTLGMLDIGRQVYPLLRCYWVDEMLVEAFAWCALGRIDPRNIAGDLLKRLKEHDRDHNTDLRRTLEVYLDCFANVKRTAQVLHIHENTLRYRIGKITELAGFGLEDSRRVCELELAMAMERLENNA